MNIGVIAAALGIGTTLGGVVVGLVKLGISIGKQSSRVDKLEAEADKWNINNRDKIREMESSNNAQTTTLEVFKEKVSSIESDIKDIKSSLEKLTDFIQSTETNRIKIESRLDYLEKRSNN